MSELHIPKLAVLASGGGTTANALARGIHDGICNAEIDLVIASKAKIGVLDLVKKWNNDWGFDTDAVVIGNATHPKGPRERGQSEQSSEAICEILELFDIDLVLQLGYMVIGNDPYIEEWGFRPDIDEVVLDTKALNWHPGILPLTADTFAEGASDVTLQAYRADRATEAAHTVHAVTYKVDEGPVYASHPVNILPGDDAERLFQRVQLVEKAVTPYVVDQFLSRQREYENNASS